MYKIYKDFTNRLENQNYCNSRTYGLFTMIKSTCISPSPSPLTEFDWKYKKRSLRKNGATVFFYT